MKKANWRNREFVVRELYAPFVIQKDSDYSRVLSEKFLALLNKAKECEADTKSISIIKENKNRIEKSIHDYYLGKIGEFYSTIKDLVADCLTNKLAVSYLHDSYAFPGEMGTEMQFFRARVDDGYEFESGEMLNPPPGMRSKTFCARYSLPGVPSLYLANTSYGCWIELGRPSESRYNVAPIMVKKNIKVFNLAVMMRDMSGLDDGEIERVRCWIKLLMLMIATSFIVKENGRSFKSEYIVSQGIMAACIELGLDGVAYYSKRVSNEFFSQAAINLVLFPGEEINKNSTSVKDKVQVGPPFNYALFRQLNNKELKYEYKLRVDENRWPKVIGDYNRQLHYRDTEFYRFDKFLFCSWREKPDQCIFT